MKLTKCVLVRNGQQCVLQGMVHIGPESLYQALQEDLDRAAADGFAIFFEGVKGFPRLLKRHTYGEARIRDFFKFIFSLFPEMAGAYGFVLQKENIKYPAGAVNADFSFREVVANLCSRGFDESLFLRILEMPKIREAALETIRRKKDDLLQQSPNDRMLLFYKDPPVFMRIILWFFARRFLSVILHLRNDLAVEILEEYFSKRRVAKAFVHYGQAHIAGIVKRLKKNGWAVVKTSNLNLVEFVQQEAAKGSQIGSPKIARYST